MNFILLKLEFFDAVAAFNKTIRLFYGSNIKIRIYYQNYNLDLLAGLIIWSGDVVC